MNARKPTKSAHPLFQAEQPFLWLPGFAGPERPYCSYNEYRDHPGGFDKRRYEFLPSRDENGAPYITPYPVSPGTHISWHTNTVPPFPYHPVPIVRTLSTNELEELGRRVCRLMDSPSDVSDDAQAVLRNQYKTLILVALAEMKLLGPVETGGSAHARTA